MTQENKTYKDYLVEYESLLKAFLDALTEVGSDVCADKLSDLEKSYPEHTCRLGRFRTRYRSFGDWRDR